MKKNNFKKKPITIISNKNNWLLNFENDKIEGKSNNYLDRFNYFLSN